MIRRILATYLLLVAILFSPFASIARGADTWQFYFPITVTDNSGVTRNYLPIMFGQGGSAFSGAGYMTSTGTDTRMQTGGANVPAYMLSTTQIPFVTDSLQGNASKTFNFYTGYSPVQTVFPIVVGQGGNISSADNDGATEPSSNFTFAWSTYFTNSSNITTKSGAIAITQASNNVTATVTGSTGLSQTLAPNGAGDFTQQTTLVGAATNWQANLTNDGDTSYSGTGTAVGTVDLKDTYAMTDGTIPSYAVIDSVTVNSYAKCFALSALNTISLVVRLGGSETDSTPQTLASGGYNPYSAALARPGGGSWTAADIPNIQAGTIIHEEVTGDGRSTQVYVTVAYHYPNTVVTYPVAGAYTGNLTSDGTNLSLSINGAVVATSTLNNAVVNTGNNWIIGSGAPYLDYYKEWVGGNLKLWYQPTAMITATTLPDRQGNQDGVITWGSNSNLTITYGAMVASVGTAASSGNSTANQIGFTPPPFVLPSGWFNTGTAANLLPSYDAISQIYNIGGVGQGMTPQTTYLLWLIAIALLLGVWLAAKTRHALLGFAVIFAFLMIGYNMTVIAGWFIFSVVVFAVSLMFMSRQYG